MKKDIQNILQTHFWLDDFRPGQREIIESVILGQDTLVFMPTGWGKSLTYQLPALALDGVCLVISPLISLMKDQVDTLQALWIRAELINSTQDRSEQVEILQELSHTTTQSWILSLPEEKGAAIKFLYIAPERLNSREFTNVLRNIKISLVAIDEAHCISQWWHDFRPSYMKIQSFIDILAGEERKFPIIWLTATATHKVREDIVERLGLEKYKSFITGFDRKNIIIVVREISGTSDKQIKVREILEKTPWVWIIYCSSKKHVVELSEYLLSQGIKTWIYKWDLSPEQREQQQNAFMNDEYKVIVATNAFGMGIDKKDIRFVIHYNLPGSIENYYQEVGRWGRDGKKSFWVVLASYGDTKIQEFFIENTYPSKSEILKFYDYLYQDFKLWEGKGTSIAKTYFVMASESGSWNDMKVWSIIKILEKYWVIARGMQAGEMEENFRGRWLTLMQEKRPHSGVLIDWKRQNLLEEEAYYKLDQIKQLLFYPHCRKRYILEYFWDSEDLETLWTNCKTCDYCLESKKYSEDDIQKFLPVSAYSIILETVKKYDEKFGQALIARLLLWSWDKRLREWNLDKYIHYGALSEYSRETVRAMIEGLMAENFVQTGSGQYPTIWVTDMWASSVIKNAYITSRISDLNSYVMHKTGNKKTGKGRLQSTPTRRSGLPKWQTYKETQRLFLAWKTVAEIALERELGISTIESHISSLYISGELGLEKIMSLIDFESAKKLKPIIAENTEGLRSIRDIYQEQESKEISYMEIKLVQAMMEKGDL